MLKDVVVNLSGRASLDFAADYAISIAATFGAHVTGIAVSYTHLTLPTILRV